MIEDEDAFDQDDVGRVDVGELVLHSESEPTSPTGLSTIIKPISA